MYNATPVENTVTKPLKDILERVCDTARGRKRSQVAISLMNEVVLWQKKVKVFENEMIPESKCLYYDISNPRKYCAYSRMKSGPFRSCSYADLY